MNLISFYEHVRCGLWALSGPFPLSAHYGLYKRVRDPPPPPTNPSRHLKKERSALPLKWLLKEGRGYFTIVIVIVIATPPSSSSRRCRPRILHHRHHHRHRDASVLKPPPPPPQAAAAAAASRPPGRHPLHLLLPSSPPQPSSLR